MFSCSTRIFWFSCFTRIYMFLEILYVILPLRTNELLYFLQIRHTPHLNIICSTSLVHFPKIFHIYHNCVIWISQTICNHINITNSQTIWTNLWFQLKCKWNSTLLFAGFRELFIDSYSVDFVTRLDFAYRRLLIMLHDLQG